MEQTVTIMQIPIELVDPSPLQPKSRQNPSASSVSTLAASMQRSGQLDPIIVVPNNGRYEVVAGHRRRRAALVLGWDKITAHVVHGLVGADMSQLRVLMDSNDEREDPTASEKAILIQEALELGLTTDDLSITAEQAAAAREIATVVRSKKPEKKAITAVPQASLEEAVALIEFADDEGSTAALQALVGTGQFDHELERRRAERARASKFADAMAKLEASGTTILENNYDSHKWVTLDVLGMKVADHKDCPGHAAFVTYDGQIRYYCTKPSLHGIGASPRPTKTEDEKAEDRRKRWSRKDHRAATIVRLRFIAGLLRQPRHDDSSALAYWALFYAWTYPIDNAGNYRVVGENMTAILGEDHKPTSNLNGVIAKAIAQYEATLEAHNKGNGMTTAIDYPYIHEIPLGAPKLAIAYFTMLAKSGYTLSEAEETFVELNRLKVGAA